MLQQVFIKISGLVVEDSTTLHSFSNSLKNISRKMEDIEFFIISGGGKLVDEVRYLFRTDPDKLRKIWEFDHLPERNIDEIAHWLSIERMDVHGKKLSECFTDRTNIEVISVAESLKNMKNELPASWDVTSDSITYWLAIQLSKKKNLIPFIILFKDVDGIVSLHNEEGKIPRRSREVKGNVIRELYVKNGNIQPNLPSYPFDDHIILLLEEFSHPFFVMGHTNVDDLEHLLENQDDPAVIRSRIQKKS